MKNHTILITGATRGIGRALLEQLAPNNRIIALGWDPAALDMLRAGCPGIATITADLAVPEQVAAAISTLSAQWPALSMLINNAAVQHAIDYSADLTGAQWQQELQVNLHAPVQLIHGLLPLLLRHSDACIVNITSVLALAAKPQTPLYCASKAGLRLFTQALRHQLRHTQVKVVEAIPPLTDTGLGADPGKRQAVPASWVASQLLAQLDGNHTEIAIGKARLARALYGVAPGLLRRLILQ